MTLLAKIRKSRSELKLPLDLDLYQPLPGSHGSIYPQRVGDDPWYRLCAAAEENPNLLNVIESLRQGELSRMAGREYLGMDGPLYHDTRAQSIMTAAQANVTGATTAKMLHPAVFTNVPSMYFSAVKKVRQTLGINVTLGATVGNITPTIYFGSSDAGTNLLATGVAQAGVNAAAISAWFATIYVTSRGGALASVVPTIAYGNLQVPLSHILSTAQSSPIPTGAIAPVNIDATAALGVMLQCANSGANGNTYAVQDLTFEALN